MQGQFNAVERITAATTEAGLIDSDRLLLTVNGWIARTRVDGVQACRQGIEAWDTSALADNFNAARLILLRRDDQAVTAIKDLVEQGEWQRDHIATWPMFHWIREDGLLDDLMTGSGIVAISRLLRSRRHDLMTRCKGEPARQLDEQATDEGATEVSRWGNRRSVT